VAITLSSDVKNMEMILNEYSLLLLIIVLDRFRLTDNNMQKKKKSFGQEGQLNTSSPHPKR
jgi:hypothetical protein